MRTVRAPLRADRMSVGVMLLGGLLCGVSFFVVALPLAFSSPFPPPPQREWIVQTSSREWTPSPDGGISAQTIVEPVTFSAQSEQASLSFAARWKLTETVVRTSKPARAKMIRVAALVASTEAVDSIGPVQASLPKTIEPPVVVPPKKPDAMGEVDQYLWEVYRRSSVKSDSSGDFTWKDPAAAKRLGMSLQAYVIGGMDRDFREQLYHAGRAMDALGIHWTILSAFRDDYRQKLASGFKASAANSQHGGSAATGGYGHGRAVDVTITDGDPETVWHWIDANGARYGLRRPLPSADPAHVLPRSNWRELAASLRNARVRVADAARRAGFEARVKPRPPLSM
jgi:hypothetical protein